jgi:hypothetical protein
VNVGQAEVDLRLNDSEFASELSAAEAKVRRTMKRIDAMRAEAQITADISQFEKREREARAALDKWGRRKAEATLGADIKKAELQIKRLETMASNFARKKYDATLELHTRRDAVFPSLRAWSEG